MPLCHSWQHRVSWCVPPCSGTLTLPEPLLHHNNRQSPTVPMPPLTVLLHPCFSGDSQGQVRWAQVRAAPGCTWPRAARSSSCTTDSLCIKGEACSVEKEAPGDMFISVCQCTQEPGGGSKGLPVSTPNHHAEPDARGSRIASFPRTAVREGSASPNPATAGHLATRAPAPHGGRRRVCTSCRLVAQQLEGGAGALQKELKVTHRNRPSLLLGPWAQKGEREKE